MFVTEWLDGGTRQVEWPTEELALRFWKRVDVAGPQECWRWLGPHDRGGYGKFSHRRDGRSRTTMAHRFAYQLIVGQIPQDMQLDHVRTRGCVHRDCVNPAHLEPVTPRENLLRSPTWAGRNAVKSTCPSGHPYDTTLLNPDGTFRQRRCSICTAATSAAFEERRKDARKKSGDRR